jgi:hypothetical protein
MILLPPAATDNLSPTLKIKPSLPPVAPPFSGAPEKGQAAIVAANRRQPKIFPQLVLC